MTIDLMRPALRRSRRKVQLIPIAILIETIASGIVAALLLAIIMQSFGLARTTARIDREISVLNPGWSIVREHTEQIRGLRREVEATGKLLAAPDWSNLLDSLRAAIPDRLWLTRLVIDESGVVEVVIRTSHPPTIPEFLRRLQSTPGVRDVRLVFTETVRVDDQEVLQAGVAAQAINP